MKKKWFNDGGWYYAFVKWLRIMKLILLIMFVAFMHVSASVYSQKTKLSISMQNSSVRDILKGIEDQSDFFFLYKNEEIDVTRKVDLDIKDVTVEYLLDHIFNGTDVSYEIVNRQIVLVNKSKGFEFISQQQSVSGKVTSISGEPIPGVTIIIKGTTQGTITDADGNYFLTNVSGGAILIFSFVGMKTQEIPVNKRNRINVTMTEKLIGLEEVVAVGYGVLKKSDVISSVISVKSESVTKVPSSDIGEMLRGKAAGVLVTLANAAPGSSSNILIRGKSSITGGNNPIVIADGVPIGSINDINANDIASIEILKDAAAQAIYGARASNGVILITTKRAEAGKAQVNYSGYYGMQSINRKFDTYSGKEFAQLRREAYRTDNNNTYLPDEEIFTPIELDVLASGKFVDWYKEVIGIAPIQNHNFSISAGTEKTKLYSSIDYMNQQGVVKGTDYQRFTIRINLDQHITKWLSLGTNASWRISKNNAPGTGGTLLSSITASPLGKIYNEDGSYRLNPSGVQESWNPLLDLETTSNVHNSQNSIMNIFLDFSPFKRFNYRFNVSRTSLDRKTLSYYTAESSTGISLDGLGYGEVAYKDDIEWQLENILTYDLQQNKHSLGFTFVHSMSERKIEGFENASSYFANDILGIYGLETAEINTPSIEGQRRALVSFAGRVQYNYDGKYYVTVSARADASTVFGANHQWGYFPAAAVGWNIYRESFIEDISAISNLKLRASYGSVGNEAIDPYQSQSTAQQQDYLLNGKKVTGYVPGSFLPNPDLKWETSTTLNAALDFGFWKNRLTGTLEFYNTSTKDLLVDRELSAALGYSNIKTNIGEVQNQGIEFYMNAVIVDNNDLTMNAGFSFSKNNNEIKSLYGILDEEGNEIDDIANEWFIGYPIDVYYQYKAIGIFQENDDIGSTHQPNAQPGDIKLYDRDGELLGPADRFIIPSVPDWFGSFNFEMKYRNFDLSVDVVTVQGITRDNPFLKSYYTGGSLRSVLNAVKQNYWTPENPTGDWPRPRESNDPDYMESFGLQDASYVRLQTVTIGYTLPNSILSKIKLSNLRIYCTGHNLITLTDYQSFSPEKQANDYPEAVSVVCGLQVSF